MPTTLDAQIVRCSFCGAQNRVTPEQREKTPICGRCKKPLQLTLGVIVVTDATFAEEVERAQLPVLVDLWAPWCGPCRMLAPAIDALAVDMAGRVRFAKLNVDENQQTAARFRADSIPLLLIFKDGKLVDRLVGLMPRDEIAKRLMRFS
jgi:thioredoxin 2